MATGSCFANFNEEPSRRQGWKYAATAARYVGRPGRMLEVGCGLGLFLEAARERGWSPRGIDFTPAFVERARARGIEVECAAPLEATFLDEQYECVLLLNILEHLYEPVEVLRQVFSALRPGGVVAIGVPNEGGLTARVGNLDFRAQGRPWAMNLSPTFPPFHVVGFSPESLRFALELVGFEVLALETVAGHNDMQPGQGPKARIESTALSAVLRAASALGRGDAIDCWARRPVEAGRA
ncbi:MAG: class I SAM-dependent methyltransferase [Myxococcota bacterium]